MPPLPRSFRPASRVALLLLLLPIAPGYARQPAPSPAAAPPAARSADVASVDAIIGAVYAAISGDSGVRRDWDRFRSLFAPGARLMPVIQSQGQPPRILVWTAEDFIAQSAPALEREGFHEREIQHRRESYGTIAHVFSTYESRDRATDSRPFARGINSFQLWHDGTRWWVQSIMWWQETPATPIPSRYLEGTPPPGEG